MGIIINFTARTVEGLGYPTPVMIDEEEVTATPSTVGAIR
jgi:hypothetical protein